MRWNAVECGPESAGVRWFGADSSPLPARSRAHSGAIRAAWESPPALFPGSRPRIDVKMPSTGDTRARQARERRRRDAEAQQAIQTERDQLRTERDQLRQRVRELEGRVGEINARVAQLEDTDEKLVAAQADCNIAQRQAAALEAEGERLRPELERLSRLTFPMTLHDPTTRRSFEIHQRRAPGGRSGRTRRDLGTIAARRRSMSRRRPPRSKSRRPRHDARADPRHEPQTAPAADAVPPRASFPQPRHAAVALQLQGCRYP